MRLGILAGLAAALAAGACGERPPEYTLQIVMLEIDGQRKDLERALLAPDGLEAARRGADALGRWSADPAFERYLERPDLPAGRDRFLALRSAFDRELGAFRATLERGDLAASRGAYPALQAACESCHVLFRPLGPRYPGG